MGAQSSAGRSDPRAETLTEPRSGRLEFGLECPRLVPNHIRRVEGGAPAHVVAAVRKLNQQLKVVRGQATETLFTFADRHERTVQLPGGGNPLRGQRDGSAGEA